MTLLRGRYAAMQFFPGTGFNGHVHSSREILLGDKRGKNSSVRFTSIDMDQTNDMENGQILQLQQRIIDDQDQDLDHLSDAIRRQRELGLLIGDELETHAQIIDETEEMVDRTDERLRQAKKKLDYVGRRVKDNSKLVSLVFFIVC